MIAPVGITHFDIVFLLGLGPQKCCDFCLSSYRSQLDLDTCFLIGGGSRGSGDFGGNDDSLTGEWIR